MTVAALGVATLALLFTVGSFWWLYARQGELRSFRPSTFAAMVHRDRTLFRFPLVFFNSGAQSMVVLNLRLRFEDSKLAGPLQWHTTHDGLETSERPPMAAAFVVPNRSAVRVFAGFAQDDPRDFILGREFTAVIDVQAAHLDGWQELVRFPLLAQGIAYPERFIPYSNERGQVPADAPQLAAQALARLRDTGAS